LLGLFDDFENELLTLGQAMGIDCWLACGGLGSVFSHGLRVAQVE
jgi:hypothetical protein